MTEINGLKGRAVDTAPLWGASPTSIPAASYTILTETSPLRAPSPGMPELDSPLAYPLSFALIREVESIDRTGVVKNNFP